ncbi:MAG: DUF2029 domain-containing protein [Ekhidna sp.]|nr:DUF2029 domain-containing protein [Ekhidna sp.]
MNNTIYLKRFNISLPKKLIYFWFFGIILRLIAINLASFVPELVPDFVYYRLPIAECILSEGWLYCDCRYNHTPFYPYLAAFMLWVAGDVPFLQVFLINLPLALGDALVPVVIFLLFRKVKNEKLAFTCSAVYALNPISLVEVAISHWDGFTLLLMMLGLLAMEQQQTLKVGIWTGLGFLLKQFPLGLFPVFLLKTRSLQSTFWMGIAATVVIFMVFSPFLINCPTTFFENLLSHPLWQGAASEKVGIGTLKNVFDHLRLPHAKIIWGVLFVSLLGISSLKANERNYVYYAGILMVTLAFFTYVTHRQLLVWCMPFIILITIEKKAYISFILLFVGYAIRIIKPDWYFGLIHLGVGVWYYLALYRRMISGHLRQYLH